MRKLVLASLTIAALIGAPACKADDPNAFETHVKKLDDPETRGLAMGQLERLSKGVVSNDDETRKKEFAEKVLPKFAEIWDDAPESRLAMLEMARDVGRPEGAVLFNKAIVLDGSREGHKAAVLALQGIREANATDSVDAVIAEASTGGTGTDVRSVRIEATGAQIKVIVDGSLILDHTDTSNPITAAGYVGFIKNPGATAEFGDVRVAAGFLPYDVPALGPIGLLLGTSLILTFAARQAATTAAVPPTLTFL